MRRGLLIGLLAGALLFAGAVGAKVANVTNPMSSDLDANTHAITNVTELGVLDAVNANGLHIVGGMPATPLSLLAGYIDPTSQGLYAEPGSLYMRRVDANTGQLWEKTGADATAWTCAAGCTP